jgi:hypothetical protein
MRWKRFAENGGETMSKQRNEKPPPAAVDMPAPPEKAPPPRATIDNSPDIDSLSQEVSLNSGSIGSTT